MICFGFLVVFACQAPPPPPTTSAAPFCQVYHPVTWSSKDTRQTKEEIDLNNAAWKAICQKAKK